MGNELSKNINFSLAENLRKLGTREKNAIKTILLGFCETKEKGKAQDPIRIVSVPDNKFTWKDFANVLLEMGVDVSSTRKVDPTGTITTFQPKTYENDNLVRNLLSSEKPKEATEQFIKSFIAYEPSPTRPLQ